MKNLTLSRYGIEPNIIIPETHFFTLSIENKGFLLDILTELKNQTEQGVCETFHLYLSEEPINIEKSVSIVFDFTEIDFNSKPITNLLIKKFSEFLGLGEQAEVMTNIENIVLNLVEEFRLKSGLNIDYESTVSGNNLAKVCSLKIDDNKQSLLERLCEYVNLLSDLKSLKLFVLVFGKKFLSNKDIDNLYKHCFDKNVRLLIIEGEDKSELDLNERRLVIDADLCTIPQGYSVEIE